MKIIIPIVLMLFMINFVAAYIIVNGSISDNPAVWGQDVDISISAECNGTGGFGSTWWQPHILFYDDLDHSIINWTLPPSNYYSCGSGHSLNIPAGIAWYEFPSSGGNWTVKICGRHYEGEYDCFDDIVWLVNASLLFNNSIRGATNTSGIDFPYGQPITFLAAPNQPSKELSNIAMWVYDVNNTVIFTRNWWNVASSYGLNNPVSYSLPFYGSEWLAFIPSETYTVMFSAVSQSGTGQFNTSVGFGEEFFAQSILDTIDCGDGNFTPTALGVCVHYPPYAVLRGPISLTAWWEDNHGNNFSIRTYDALFSLGATCYSWDEYVPCENYSSGNTYTFKGITSYPVVDPYHYGFMEGQNPFLTSTCGDGTIDVGEECDLTNLGGNDCIDLGFIGGSLSCSNGCTFLTHECILPIPSALPTCGNGVVDVGEQCDGINLDGRDCLSLGYDYGDLSCSADCMSFNTSLCSLNGTFVDVVNNTIVGEQGHTVLFYSMNESLNINFQGNLLLQDNLIMDIARNGSMGVLNLMVQDNQIYSGVLTINSRGISGDGVPNVTFFNNTIDVGKLIYPIYNDSFTSGNVIEFTDNTYSADSILELCPGLSAGEAIKYALALSAWYSSEPFLETAARNMVVNDSYVAEDLCNPNRVLYGQGLISKDTYMGALANQTMVGFIFSDSIYDLGNGTYINNTIWYVNESDIIMESLDDVYPVESQLVTNNISVIIYDEFSSVRNMTMALNNSGTIRAAICNLTSNGSSGICSPYLGFYDPEGVYDYSNVIITDRFGMTPAYDRLGNLTYYALMASLRDRDFITFSGTVIGIPNVQCDVPIRVVNSGNRNITNVTLTAYDLIGATDSTKKLQARYFRAGKTLADSVELMNGTAVQLPAFTLGAGGNVWRDIVVWVSAPANTTPQYYSPSQAWSLSLH